MACARMERVGRRGLKARGGGGGSVRERENAAGKETCTYFRGVHCHGTRLRMNYPTLSLTLAEWGWHKQLHALFECTGMMHFKGMELSV